MSCPQRETNRHFGPSKTGSGSVPNPQSQQPTEVETSHGSVVTLSTWNRMLLSTRRSSWTPDSIRFSAFCIIPLPFVVRRCETRPIFELCMSHLSSQLSAWLAMRMASAYLNCSKASTDSRTERAKMRAKFPGNCGQSKLLALHWNLSTGVVEGPIKSHSPWLTAGRSLPEHHGTRSMTVHSSTRLFRAL